MNIITKDIYNNFEPLPEDIRGFNSDSEVFGILVEKVKPRVIIEVGTWKGASAINMANHTKRLNLKTDIYCVDTWLGAEEFWTSLKDYEDRNLVVKNGYPQIYYQFLSNVFHSNNTDIIIPVPNTSFIGSKILKHMGVRAQLIYIDGSHEYEDVITDIRCYKELLDDGGIIFGDDFGYHGVNRAVRERLPQNEIEIYNNNWWIHQKK